MGRLAQQLGLPHLAAQSYRALLEGPGTKHLAREAAHNLALIYRASGSPGLARQVLRRHLTF